MFFLLRADFEADFDKDAFYKPFFQSLAKPALENVYAAAATIMLIHL